MARPSQPAPPVRIELLGGFSVVIGESPVADAAWPSRRSAELVQLLALARPHRLMREQVLEALWPHLDPGAGAANLRKAAHHARTATGCDDAVVLAGGRVALFPDTGVEVDVEQFERVGRAALAGSGADACAAAADACAGELLPGALYEEWTQSRRDLVRCLHLDLLRGAGQWDRVADLDPVDEEAHCELMRAALDEGNRHGALRTYGRLRSAMERELGISPGPRSQALYAACVAGMRAAATAFVGRDVELAQALEMLETASREGTHALVVRGSAGIGKSTLCRELGTAATGRGWCAVTATATTGGDAFGPLVDVVEQLIRLDRSCLDNLPDGARSTLAALTSLAGPSGSPAAGLGRHMVIGAVHRLLMAYAAAVGAAGVVLVVDDAHLADDGTAEACAQLARTRGPLPLLVVLAFRADHTPPALAECVAGLDRAGRTGLVNLGPLDDEEVASLVMADRRVEAGSSVLTEIVATAQGNPFFALELARDVGTGSPLTVPRTAWEAVTSRFLDLDEAAVAMLRRLALAGGDLSTAQVLALTGLAEPDAFALLDAALEAGALVVAGAGYRFRHDLIRVALLEQIPPHHRVSVHRDTARRLAGADAEPALIARHWLDGDSPGEAEPWLLAAARRAMGRGGYADALRHLDTVLEHTSQHADALCLRAETLDALGDMEAPAAYAAAAEAVGDPLAHEIRALQALAQIKRGDPPGGLRTLDGIAPVTVKGRIAQALAWSGAAVLGFADPETGTAMAAESRRLALETGDHATLVIASWAQAAAAHARDDLRSSVWEDLLETATFPELAVNVFDGHLCITQRLLYGARPYADVIAFADRFADEAARIGAVRGHAYAVTLRGEARLLSGDLDAADADLNAGARLSRATGGAVGEGLALQRRAEVAMFRGRPAEAAALLDDALAVARDSDCGFHLMDRIYGTRLTLATDPDTALATLRDAEAAVRGPLETCPGCRITFAVPAAIAAARGGDLDHLSDWVEQSQWLADVVMRLPAWHAALAEVRGHAARATGADPRPHFSAAAEQYRACGQPLDEQRCAALAES